MKTYWNSPLMIFKNKKEEFKTLEHPVKDLMNFGPLIIDFKFKDREDI